MNNADTGSNEQKILAEKIKGIRIAMLTTVNEDGTLRSRPMTTQEMEGDGSLWFFTGASSPLSSDVQADQQVNIAYVAPDDNRYVSVSGTARRVRDQQKIDEMWNPLYKAWFPKGKDDPDLTLLKVKVSGAEYWDASSSKMVVLYHIAKSAITGSQDMGGENEKIRLT